jgi:hypothetical protein
MTESEKFRTERLVARPWQIEDLPLAMELWGDPAVTALIDSRRWRGMDSNFRSREGVTLSGYSGESFSPKKIASVKQLTHPSTPARFRCGAIPG